MGMTVAQYAQHRGVSRQAVYKAVQQGRIRAQADGTIDQPSADADWDRTTMRKVSNPAPPAAAPVVALAAPAPPPAQAPQRPAPAGPTPATAAAAQDAGRRHQRPATQAAPAPVQPPDPDDPLVLDYNAARTRREAANAQLAELKLEEERGHLVRRELVASLWFSETRAWRERILALPHQLAPALAGLTEANEIEALLEEFVQRVLYELTDDPPLPDGKDGGA